MDEKRYEIYRPAGAEILVKRSRFIGETFPIKSDNEANDFIIQAKKKFFDAKHHCFAYRLGNDENGIRLSDDKEPSGTGGRPILQVIQQNGMVNTLIIVTRYFGGTLLGTGGLSRAYRDAAKLALDNSVKFERKEGVKTVIKIPYNLYGKIENLINEKEAIILSTEYKEFVTVEFLTGEETSSALMKELSEAAAGSIDITAGSRLGYGTVEGRVIWL